MFRKPSKKRGTPLRYCIFFQSIVLPVCIVTMNSLAVRHGDQFHHLCQHLCNLVLKTVGQLKKLTEPHTIDRNDMKLASFTIVCWGISLVIVLRVLFPME
jgi:hypothetical protein